MTVKQLRDALALIAERYQDFEVVIWLPGSRITIEKVMGITGEPNEGGRCLLVEGTRRDV